MADKTFLITGATGNQGGAVINALLASRDSSNATIFAVTRNVDSAGAKALVAKSPNQIRLIKGDLTRCQEIFDAARTPISGVFCVSVPPMGIGAKTEVEEVQGKALVDAAFANGVKHFVFTSVDRGPDSDSNETDVPHFITKARIEKHLKEKFTGPGRSWTILRPVAFMENFESMGKVFPTAWNVALSPTTKLQLVSTADIGWYAAEALLKPKEYSGRSISLAGDALTYEEVNDVFKKTIGKGVPTTFGFVGSGLLWAVKDVGLMFKFFEHTGYAADIPALRKEHPELLNFSDWMKKSKFAEK